MIVKAYVNGIELKEPMSQYVFESESIDFILAMVDKRIAENRENKAAEIIKENFRQDTKLCESS